MSTSLTSAAVLLDNTVNGTATINVSSGSNLNLTSIKQGLEFSIGVGYTASLSSLKLGIGTLLGSSAPPSFTVELWSSGGASVLASQGFTGSNTAINYYDFALTQSAFSNLAAGSYYLTLSSTNTRWMILSPQASPTSPTSGFSFVQYRRSTDGGSNWGTTGNQNSILLQGTVNAAAVPASGLAAMGTLGVAGVARRRRRL